MKKSTFAVIGVIIAALAVMVVMIVFALKQPPETDGGTCRVDSYEVFSVAPSAVSELTLTSGGTTLTLTQSDGTWCLPDDPEMPIDPDRVLMFLSRLVTVTSERRFTDVTEDELGGYGLDTPAISLSVTDSAYGTRTLQIGKESVANGGYYCTVSGNSSIVYVIDGDTVSGLSLSPESLLPAVTVQTVTAKTLIGFEYTTGEDSYRFTYDMYGSQKDGSTYYWFVSVNGMPNQPVGTAADAWLTDTIVCIGYEKLVSWHQADLASYGITTDSPVFTVRYRKTVTAADGTSEKQDLSYSLRLGGTDAENRDYLSPVDTSLVYLYRYNGLHTALDKLVAGL